MRGYLELPTTEVRRWLADAAQECGYELEMAQALAYSAWWLENRGVRGVQRACLYLLGLRGRGHATLQPRMDSNCFVCLDPIQFGMQLVSLKLKEIYSFDEWIGGLFTADPVLSAPIITQMLEYKYNLHMTYLDQRIIFSDDGIALASKSLAGFAIINNKSGIETSMRLVLAQDETVSFTNHYEKQETLCVPQFRYLEGGGFRFDE